MKLKANLDFTYNGKSYKQGEVFETDNETGGGIIHAGHAFEVYNSDVTPSQVTGKPEPDPAKLEGLPEPETTPHEAIEEPAVADKAAGSRKRN